MRILLAEDEADIGNAVHQILNREGHVADWVTDGHQAWEYLQSNFVHYELAVLDWMMPGLSGIEVCHRMHESQHPARVLMLTAKDAVIDRVQGLDAGADDYLVKPFRMPELLARIRSIQRRTATRLEPNILKIGSLVLDRDNLCIYSILDPSAVAHLSAKDFLLLEYLMRHNNMIMTRDQIAAALLLDQNEIISNLIVVRVKILRQKLLEIGFEKTIESVYGLGYRLISNVLEHDRNSHPD
jgi:DNA-binding response OmpR family regulator